MRNLQLTCPQCGVFNEINEPKCWKCQRAISDEEKHNVLNDLSPEEREQRSKQEAQRKTTLNGQSDEKVGAASGSTVKIIFGVILVAIGFLIYANGEQLGVTLLGGEDQIMRDMMNGAMFDKGYTNRASSIGNFLQGLYIVVIAIGSIMVLLGLAKSKK